MEQAINLEIDSELWRRASVRAAEEGITKKRLVAKALAEYLGKEKLMERKLSIYKTDYGDLMLYNKHMSESARRITLKEFIEAVEASTAWDDFDSGVYAEAMREVGLDFTAYDDPDEMWEDFKKAVDEAKK